MTIRDDSAVKDSARKLLPVNDGAWVIERARASLRDRSVRLGAETTARIDPSTLWEYGTDRARGRHAHGFTFLADWVGAGQQLTEGEAKKLSDLLHEMVLAWDERFGRARETAPEMAFHDETTAQRLLGVVGALDQLTLTDEQREYFEEFAERTAAILMEPEFYSGVNNHGMFQDLALLAWSVLVAPAPSTLGTQAWDLAAKRLHTYFSACFTPEGVHVENTPTYHVMVSRYLPVLDALFVSAASDAAELYEQLLPGAVRYAVHCVTPETLFPPVSDTHRRRLDTSENIETFAGGEFEYAATGGRRGARPPSRTAVFPASGYGMTRSAWGDANATYVHFTCAYNADYHKHSDEQSVYLRSGGRDLLCEAGAYGYNWDDPFTKYAYSSSAHNSMVINGTGLPRTEPPEVRLLERSPLDELALNDAGDDRMDVTGITRRYPGRIWTRRLRVDHGDAPADSAVRIHDLITSQDGEASLRFLSHLGPGLRAKLREKGVEVFDGTQKVMEVEFRTETDIILEVVEGKEGRAPQGWYFPTFGERVPAPVITVDAVCADLDLKTEVRLSGFVWNDEDRTSRDPLTVSGRSLPWIPSAASPQRGDAAILILSRYDSVDARTRLTAELVKNDRPYWYVPGISRKITESEKFEGALVFLEELAGELWEFIRGQRDRGVEIILATVGEGYVPAAIAALSTGTPLISLDPVIPFRAGDPRAERITEWFAHMPSGGPRAPIDVLSSSTARKSTDRAVSLLDLEVSQHAVLSELLTVDAEEVLSNLLNNEATMRDGPGIRYIAAYDRRRKEFLVDVLERSDVLIAVRVFKGKEQVAGLPYAAGSFRRISYEGSGPHRLRIHVRDGEGDEIAAFTTGTIRVR